MTDHKLEDSVDRLVGDWRRERPDLATERLATFMRLAFVAQHVVGPVGENAIAKHGIQQGEFDVLASLRRGGEPYARTPSALSAELMMSRAGMTKRVDSLETAGLVARTPSAEDRRSLQITLTDEGRRVVDEALEDLVDQLGTLMSRLSERERAGLDKALRALMP